ncbi:MAG: FAD-dependent thymidylate synthase [Ruminococcaceae bacterium]|nr:FAD-dependent thymidylate synthase [Oscillospiraceae bacterium]
MVKVTLITHTPEPERAVAAAAKLCYSPSTIDDIREGLTEEKVASFVDMLASIGHESPLEHVSFTFGIEGVSRACTHQLVRHRMASYSQKSQRYVSEGGFEYVIPPEVEAVPEALELYKKAMAEDQEYYEKIAAILKEKHLKEMIESGMDEKAATRTAEKKAIEDARFILPNACETKIVVTMNARSLLNFFRHRCCNRAQWEIREVADEMLRLVSAVAPNLFKKAGAPCVHGACPEGKMTCGKAAEMREHFKALKG